MLTIADVSIQKFSFSLESSNLILAIILSVDVLEMSDPFSSNVCQIPKYE
jgi:hypothetical protein